jgi:hypothetical protein
MGKATYIISLVVTAIVFFLAGRWSITASSPSDPPRNLATIAREMNSKLPEQIDKNTFWTHAATSDDNTLVYFYRISGVQVDQIDSADLIKFMKTAALNNYRTSPHMEELRALKANLQYIYNSEEGDHLWEFTVKHSEIEESAEGVALNTCPAASSNPP